MYIVDLALGPTVASEGTHFVEICGDMRSLLAQVCLITTFCLPGPLSAAAPGLATRPVAIEVAPGGWQAARVEDIATVLNSVVEVLLPYFPEQTPKRLVVAWSQEGPHVLREISPGAGYRVFLSVRDTRWDQFAYQFAHELCHVFATMSPTGQGPKEPRGRINGSKRALRNGIALRAAADGLELGERAAVPAVARVRPRIQGICPAPAGAAAPPSPAEPRCESGSRRMRPSSSAIRTCGRKTNCWRHSSSHCSSGIPQASRPSVT